MPYVQGVQSYMLQPPPPLPYGGASGPNDTQYVPQNLPHGGSAQDYNDYYSGQSAAGGRAIAGLNLYDPALLSQLNQILGPYFNQQLGQLSGQKSSSVNQAGQSAGAYAAANNLNPSAYVQTARSKAGSGYDDMLQQLLSGQLGSLLNAGTQSQQFKAGNLQAQAGINQGLAGQYQNQLQFQQQQANQPTFWDYLVAGLVGGLGGFASGFGTGYGQKLGGP